MDIIFTANSFLTNTYDGLRKFWIDVCKENDVTLEKEQKILSHRAYSICPRHTMMAHFDNGEKLEEQVSQTQKSFNLPQSEIETLAGVISIKRVFFAKIMYQTQAWISASQKIIVSIASNY